MADAGDFNKFLLTANLVLITPSIPSQAFKATSVVEHLHAASQACYEILTLEKGPEATDWITRGDPGGCTQSPEGCLSF